MDALFPRDFHNPHPAMAPHRLLFIVLGLASPLAAAPAKPLGQSEALKIAAHIDDLLEADLSAQKLNPNPLVPDDIFLRRSYLGIVGRIPTPQEAISFLESEAPNKRAVLVDKLVASPGYNSASFNYFADLLRLQSNRDQYGLGWHVWLRESLAEDKPWDELVYDMLSADGHSIKNPAVGYYLRDRGMLLDNVSNSMQVFLGHQIGCAQCHDHPTDRWTQMEYYELASFSSDVSYQSMEARKAIQKVVAKLRKDPPKPRKNASRQEIRRALGKQRAETQKIARDFRYVFRDFRKNEISSAPSKELKLPDDYQYEDGDPGEIIPPATLFGEKLHNVAPEDRREAFATWVTTGNPYFAKVFANRLWHRTFGHGLVDPVDDWSKESKTAHPEVLAYLEQVMKRVGYRTRDFERILYQTRLFQRAASVEESTPGTVLTFQGPQLRRMRAEEMHDSLLVLTFGNVDDKINTRLADRWQSYTESVLSVLNSSTSQLVDLQKELKSAEEKRYAYQSAMNKLNAEIRKATAAGNQAAVARLRREVGRARATALAARKDLPMMMQRGLGNTAKAATSMRASEYPTPFRGDHLVRQFGGSDRLIPESSDTLASVPQALTLLNGRIATTTENRRSKMFEALAEITNAETRLDYLFLAYFSTYPTPAEKEAFLPLASDKDELFTLARAMLTSKRFLFVQ